MISLDIHKTLKSAHGEMDLSVQLELKRGEFVTLYGKSGAGKTSLLRIIAGLLTPDHGRIEVHNNLWLDKRQGMNMPPRRRNVGFVFQDYALFPHMTVKQNLSFALKKGQSDDIVHELLEIVELSGLQDRKPNSLSGGQKQRVALARAIVQKPDLLLLDEPLSALDYAMRTKLQDYLLTVHRNYDLTTILVSHDLSEIVKLSSTVVLIEEGKIVNQGDPKVLFQQRKASGKFQFTGKILAMDPQDFLFVISILIGNDIVKVVVDENEAADLQVGDIIWVASKAFNPVIRKLI